MVLVFSQGKWLNLVLPHVIDRLWSKDHIHIYGAVVQKYIEKGFSQEKSSQLGEAYVYKLLCPGLKYDRMTEMEIQSLEEKA